MRSKAEFEKYVFKKSAEKIAEKRRRKKLKNTAVTVAAAVCFVTVMGFMGKGLIMSEPISDSMMENDTNAYGDIAYNAVGETVTDEAESLSEPSDFNSEIYIGGSLEINGIEENTSSAATSAIYDVYDYSGGEIGYDSVDSVSGSLSEYILFDEAFENGGGDYLTPDYIYIYKGDESSFLEDKDEIIKFCGITLDLTPQDIQEDISNDEFEPETSQAFEYEIIIGYYNSTETVISVCADTVTVNGANYTFTDEYKTMIEELFNNKK